MRNVFWVVLAATFGIVAGCGEFVTNGERNTVIDVVGDPADPTPDRPIQPDILGSNLSPSDSSESITDSSAEQAMPKPFADDSGKETNRTEDPDISDGNTSAKPVSLKAKKTGSDRSRKTEAVR